MSLEIDGYELTGEDDNYYHFHTLQHGTFSIGKISEENPEGAADLQAAIDILLLNIETQSGSNE